MPQFTFSLEGAIKGYYKYSLDGLPGSIYVPRGMVVADAPATITLTADGFAEPKATPVQDPAELQAAATKAAERAVRAQAAAAKLAAQVELLKAHPVAPQPATRAKKAKAVAA